jgi:hypothetical protein
MKGSLVVVLLLSLFSFSSVNFYESQQKQVSKTELVVCVSRTVKRTHSFRTVLSFRKNNSVSVIPQQNLVTILFQTKQTKTKTDDSSRKRLAFRRSTEHFKSAFIPHRSDEDNSVRG